MICPKCGKQMNGTICGYCGLNLHKNKILFCGNEAERSIHILLKASSNPNADEGNNRPIVITEKPQYDETQYKDSNKSNHNTKGVFIVFSVFIILVISTFIIVYFSKPSLFFADKTFNAGTSSLETASTSEESRIDETKTVAQASIHYYHFDLPKNSAYPVNTYFGSDCYSELESKASNNDELIKLIKKEMYSRMENDPVLASAILANIDKTIGTHYAAYLSADYDEWIEAINRTSKTFISDNTYWKRNIEVVELFFDEQVTFSVEENIKTDSRMGMESVNSDYPSIIKCNEDVGKGHYLHCIVKIKGNPFEFDYYIEGGFIPVNIEYDYSKFTLDY